MARSKPPKDVLELGKHLVRELGYEDSFDTLGRWMSHHVAELIDQSENGDTEGDRLEARKRATETILRIWEHRAALPGKAYPLSSYKDILQVLEHLKPSDNPFWEYGYPNSTTRDQLAGRLFDYLTRLTITLLLMKLPPDGGPVEADSVVKDSLDETEQRILISIQSWVKLLEIEKSGNVKADKNKRKHGNPNLANIALELIDQSNEVLVELQTNIRNDDQ